MIELRIGDVHEELAFDEWESRVRAGRIPPDALVRFEPVTGDAFVAADTLESFQDLRDDAALAWRGRFAANPPPLVTALLVGVQLRLWWLARVPSFRESVSYKFMKSTTPQLEDGEVWRLLTMGFLHVDTLHVALNMLWLSYTGWNLERALGWRNLLTIYVAAVVGGSVASTFGAPQTASLGASGGIFGLIAAAVIFGLGRPEMLPSRGRRYFGFALLPYLLVMFLSGLSNETTDNWAHGGGLFTGAALALLMDPPGLDRRPGWNVRIRSAVAVGIAGVLLGLWVAGPRITPILAQETVRAIAHDLPARARDTEREVAWDAPASWMPGMTSSGEPGFRSRYGHRSWAVSHHRESEAPSHDSLYEAWLARVRAAYPDAQASPMTPAALDGQDAVTARAVVSEDDGEVSLTWHAATRGLWSLQAIWEVASADASRLAAMHERLLARIRWNESTDVAEARTRVDRYPQSVDAKQALADALGANGELAEATALLTALVDEEPQNVRTWQSLVQLTAWYPEAIATRHRWWATALSKAATPKLILHVVRAMERNGEDDLARGVLELAWTQAPGDHILRNARQRRGLPTALDSATSRPRRPWWASDDPSLYRDVLALGDTPIDLERAARIGALGAPPDVDSP